MKTVILDARFWGPSHTGLGRYTQSLITALYALKPEFKISLLALKSKRRVLQRCFPRWTIIPVTASHYTLSEQIQIPQVLNKLQPDLVHFLHFNVPLSYQKPFIVTIHDLIKHHSRGLKTTTQWPLVYPFKRLGYKFVINHALKQSQLILTPSNWVKNDIKQIYHISQDKIVVTPEAAEPVFFKPPSQRFRDLIPDKPYFIYAGNAYPHKNLIQLIKAIQEYNQKFAQNLHLVVVTSKDIFYQRLRIKIRQLNALGVVKIKGFTTDIQLQALYHHARAFMTASLFEGFGLPGLEAMAAKTLVLSSNRSSLPEVYGSYALYFNPDNLTEIVRVIGKVMTMSPKTRQQWLNQAQRYSATFSWQKTAQLTLNAYQQLL